MRLIIEVGHPNDVHQFKYLHADLVAIGWDVLILAKQKDIVIELLKAYNLPYVKIGVTKSSMLGKALTFFGMTFDHYKITKRYSPGLILSRNSPHSAYVAKILGIPHIGFADTENSGIADKLSSSFVDYIFTSHSFTKKFKKPQFFYPGYIETWYLHPKRFIPNPEVLGVLGVQDNEPYIILRFISWEAHHDKGFVGLTDTFKINLVKTLLNHGKVFISSEKRLPSEIEEYEFSLPPEMMHDALFYASLFYGESATMASECAMLGTPAIYLDPVGRGYTNEQEQKYGLVSNFSLEVSEVQESLKLAEQALLSTNFAEQVAEGHDKMLKEIIEPVSFMKWFIVNYPASVEELERNEEYWKIFQ